MRNFAGNLIARHTRPETNVSPRLRGRFEPDNGSFGRYNFSSQDIAVVADGNLSKPDDQTASDTHEELSTTRPRKRPAEEPVQPANEMAKPPEKLNEEQGFESVKPTSNAITQQANEFETKRAIVAGEPSPQAAQALLPASELLRPADQHNFNKNYSPANKENDEEVMELPVTAITANNPEAMQTALNGQGEDSRERATGISTWVNESKPAAMFHTPGVRMSNVVANGISMSQPGTSGTQLSNNVSHSFHEAPQPVIKVSIGRIEVRAIMPSPPPPVKSREPSKPRLSLDDFLNQHNRNGQ